MAALVRRAGDIGQKVASVTKYQVIPTSKMLVARIRPPLVKSSQFIVRKLGPPMKRSSRLFIAMVRPPLQRSYRSVLDKVQPQIDRTASLLTSKMSSVTRDTKSLVKVDGDGEGTVPEEGEEDGYRERYIPITRRSIIRQLMQKKDFLSNEEKKIFEDFALALDSAIVYKYHGVLQELKNLFDPINPDKDTIQTRKLNPRERQDSEFWLLERLDDIMEKANFHELPQSVVKKAMEEHEVTDGVMVSVDTAKYDVLKFWALGKEKIPVQVPWYRAIFYKKEDLPKPMQYYKRVVVAIRFKRDQKLMLKSFKEIPVRSLEMMLPDGKIKIGKMDKGIIATSVGLATIGVIAKVVTIMASMNIDWTLIVSGVTGLIAVRAYSMYSNKRNKYLADLSRLLYFKNVANNRGLLALLVDRAEDESFKEALLVYTFLLANRPRSLLDQKSLEMSPDELGGMTRKQLEDKIVEYVAQVTGTTIEIEASEAITLLSKFGLLSEIDEKLHVLSLQAALRNLPQQPQSLVARATESDLSEGYDRDEFLETEEQYEKEEKIQKRVGWF